MKLCALPLPDEGISRGGRPTMKRICLPQILAIAMLLWALYPENPYAYYTLLRWVCFGVYGYLAFYAMKQKMDGWSWILGITAFIFNPLFPVYLTRTIWSFVDIAAIGIAFVSVFQLPKKQVVISGIKEGQNESI